MGAPKGPKAFMLKGFLAVLVVLGIVFPLVGLSLLVVWLVDFLVIRRIPSVRRFFNA